MTSPGGGRGLPKMVTTSDKRLEGVTHYRDVDHFCFYTYHLFYFFIFVNHNSSCLLYYLFYVLMSIKNLLLTSLSIVAYYQRRCLVWNSALKFCRKPFNIFVEHISVFLPNNFQYSWRSYISILVEHLITSEDFVVVLPNTLQYFFEIISQYFCTAIPSIF